MKKLVLGLMVMCSMNVVANEQQELVLKELIIKVNIEAEKNIQLMQQKLEKEIELKMENEIEKTLKLADVKEI